MLIWSLDVKRGGITKATIKRANFLSEKYKEVLIITFTFQQYHKQIIQKLYDKQILSKKVRVLNFFEELKPNKKRVKRYRNMQHLKLQEKGYEEFIVKDKHSYRYYKDGLYCKYKRFTEEGHVTFIDYMDASRHRYKREEFDAQEKLVRIRHMDQVKNRPRIDRYIDDKGFCYLTVDVNPVNGKTGLTARLDGKLTEYANLNDCQQGWLKEVLKNIDYPVVFSELRSLDIFLRNVKHKNVKKIAVVHSSHLASPYDEIEVIKKDCVKLFRHSDKFDKIVFLTREQKEDVELIYGKKNNFTVIPHAGIDENIIIDKKNHKHNNKLAVTLARYERDKRLEESIEAFKYVVEEIPEAQYHIYGNGNMQDDLETLIKQLNLGNNVFLKGYSLDIYQAYSMAACSILTSRQEGFGMVIAESMAAGTPVICYDIKYGPKDLIENEKNGFIVPNNDRKSLADRIIKVMKSDKTRQELSLNALSVRETFSEKNYQKNWLDLIKSFK